MVIISQIITASMGTDIYLLILNNCKLAAIPAKSAIHTPKFAIIRANIAKKAHFTPYLSLIKSDNPFPVTTAILAVIS